MGFSFRSGLVSGLTGWMLMLNFLARAQVVDLDGFSKSALENGQIINLVTRANSRGFSEKELVRLAELQGVSEARVEQIRSEMRRLKPDQTNQAASVRLRDENTKAFPQTRKTSLIGSSATASLKENQNFDRSEIFGSYLFKNPNLTFSPTQNIPTPHNYILGPGDEIIIDIWGSSEKTYRQTISSEGTIRISRIGPIYVNGLTIEESRKRIINRLVKIYSGLRAGEADGNRAYADVTLGKLRNIKVNIIGEAEVPGTYSVSSLSTVFNALYAANGPGKNGSMRYIEVYRGGVHVTTMDIYKFLMSGDESENIRLFDQDVINIRNYKNRIHISGQIKRAGYYELTHNENFKDLLRYAGGFTAKAYTDRILNIRFTEKQKEVVTVYKDQFGSFSLRNGDKLFINEVLNRYSNRLRISGAVFRPGTYRFEQGMTVRDLISEADGITGDAYLDRGLIVRLRDDMKTEFLDFSLSDVFSKGEGNLTLQEEDSVIIRSVLDMSERDKIRITGEVLHPGEFRYHENMTLGDVLLMAGGVKRSSNGSFVELSRAINSDSLVDKSLMSVLDRFPIKDLDISSEDKETPIKPLDVIKVNKSSGYERLKTVFIRGEIDFPGEYAILSEKDQISDLLKRCGSLKEKAFVDGAFLVRPSNRSKNFSVVQDKNLALLSRRYPRLLDEGHAAEEIVSIDLRRILADPGGNHDLALLDGDILLIPPVQGTVFLRGELMYPSVLPYDASWKLKDFIKSSGGFTQNAKQSKVYLVHYNGKAESTKRILWIRKYPRVQPGSEIVVPRKSDRRKLDFNDLWKTTTSILGVAFLISRF